MSHGGSNFYQRFSLAILAGLVFLLPLVGVGAMKARSNNRNDVKGWLPPEYPETATYKFYRDNFEGEEFILVSWEGCTGCEMNDDAHPDNSDPRLELMARKLLPPPEEASRIDRPLFFKTAQTGPRAIQQMVGKPLNLDRDEAIARLTGALIGPPPQAWSRVRRPTTSAGGRPASSSRSRTRPGTTSTGRSTRSGRSPSGSAESATWTSTWAALPSTTSRSTTPASKA